MNIAHSDIMLVTGNYQSCIVKWITNLICYRLPHQGKCFVSMCEILTAETCGKLSKCTIIVKGSLSPTSRARIPVRGRDRLVSKRDVFQAIKRNWKS